MRTRLTVPGKHMSYAGLVSVQPSLKVHADPVPNLLLRFSPDEPESRWKRPRALQGGLNRVASDCTALLHRSAASSGERG